MSCAKRNRPTPEPQPDRISAEQMYNAIASFVSKKLDLERIVTRLILLSALALVPVTVLRMIRAILTRNIDPTAEVWTAIAYDWHHGVAYRPLLSPDGYGGTRYFPGHVILQAAFMRVMSPLASGFAVTTVAMGLLLTAGC